MRDSYLKLIQQILAIYARKVINDYQPFVIAITGSAGKTSTKEAIYQVLSDQFGENVRKNEGNLNAELGVPLTILGYKKVPNKFVWPFFLLMAAFRLKEKRYPKYLILEMGVEHPGDIDYLTSIAKPDIAVVTSVDMAHMANFSGIESYQKEKLSLIGLLKENGTAFINIDDAVLDAFVTGKDSANIRSIGILNQKSDYRAEEVKITSLGMSYRICSLGHKIAVKSRLLGSQMIYSQLFAFAIADHLKISSLSAAKSLEKIRPYPGRMKIIEGKKDILIIDDTYNASPTSVKAALQTLFEIEYSHRKVAIIGNMNELGEYESIKHKEIGEFAKEKCDLAIFVGPNASVMRKSYDDAKSSIMFSDRRELIKNLDNLIMKFDMVLVKASQNNNFFEEVVKKLMKNPVQANHLLVRQSHYWMKKK